MNKVIKLFIFMCMLLPIHLCAQYKINGVVVDTSGSNSMGYTSVSIMKSSDSVLQAYTRADEDGKFEIEVPQKGNYFIRFSHPSYVSYVEKVSVENASTTIDSVYMNTLSAMWTEVIIKESRSITVKGDTIEYTADSFKTREFANVDELLKQLPGIEVDQNGKITAQGKSVQKMLVDGDEFFSDDPAVLAKMLRASAIDKVQVFDNKSEEAKATGIDDGEQVRTINLQLKDEAKQGYFGKLEGGYGNSLHNDHNTYTPQYFYQGQAMINAYAKKRKFTAFAITSNTNKTGLGWDDASSYGGGGNSFTENDDGTYSYSGEMGDFGGQFSGQGLPKTINGGAHYDNKYGKDAKNSYAFDYRINVNNAIGYQNTRSQYIMPDTQYVSNSNYNFENKKLANNLSAKTEINIDSLNKLVIKVNGNIGKSENVSNTVSNNETIDGALINESNATTSSDRNSKTGKVDISYIKKMKKEGRVLTATFIGNYSNSDGITDYKSTSEFYVNNTTLNYNQKKESTSEDIASNIKLTYSEPLIKEKLFMTLGIGNDYKNSIATLSTFDKMPGGQDTFNSLFSSDTRYTIMANNANGYLRYTSKKWNVYGGVNIVSTQYQNIDKLRIGSFKEDYFNFFPTVSVRYNKSRNTNTRFVYRGSSKQPSLSQVQVLVQNSDPLNIRLGNPDLVQEFRHNVSLTHNFYKVISENSFYVSGNMSVVQNALSESRNITPEGVNTFQTINVNGNWDANMWAYYSFKLKPIKTRVSLGLNSSYNNRNSILNNIHNRSQNISLGPSLGLNYYKDTGLSVQLDVSPSYNINKTSVYTGLKSNFFNFRYNSTITYSFSNSLLIGLTSAWTYREKLDAYDKNNSVFINNIYVQKQFLKNKSITLRLEGNDILNQNLGVNRSYTDNVISNSDYSIIKRYFMFIVTWNFTKGAAKPASIMEIN